MATTTRTASGDSAESSVTGAAAANSGTKPSTFTREETPFISDPAQVSALDIPVSYVRQMEEAQRVYSRHSTQQRMYTYAWNHAAMTIGMQCGWLGVGAWIISRGLRYSNPLNSVVARWVQHRTVLRLTTPISCLGLAMVTLTASQLPYDVIMLREASAAMASEEASMKGAMEARRAAFEAGKKASDELKEAELADFRRGMA